MGEKICIQVFCGEPEGKGPLGRTRRVWEYNIKMDLQYRMFIGPCIILTFE